MSQLQRITITPDQLKDESLILTGAQLHYLKRVLRLQTGDRFIANAPSHPWLAALTHDHCAQLLEALPPKPPLPVHIHLIAALPKTGFDEVVRQSTELGVGTLWPILSDRTLLKPSPKKLERWQRIAAEATEQCERTTVPAIRAPGPFQATLTQMETNHRYICTARCDARHLLEHLRSPETSHSRPDIPQIAIAIGPEGGWTDAEVDQAVAQHYRPISLGPTILRAVTAPLAAIALIQSHYTLKNSVLKTEDAAPPPQIN